MALKSTQKMMFFVKESGNKYIYLYYLKKEGHYRLHIELYV